MARRQFGISTHLFHAQRLSRDHLLEIAAHGFECVEVYATRTHFDYHNPAAVADLQQWLADAGVELRSIHAPTADSYIGGRWSGALSLASADPETRAYTIGECEHALHIARRIPTAVFVAHLGVPRTQRSPNGDSRAAARRSVEELVRIAEPLGVKIALEVIPNELSRAASIVHFIEEDFDGVGICLDIGHAHLDGDVIDAVETVSEHLIATHLHDNAGRNDDHLVPFEGTIDWPGALLAVQKIGYDGPFMLEVVPKGSTKETLARARKARERIEQIMADG
ncbi:MAG TPA: sugar phosphate isomerase/epimerase family protein [Vicinamibacterales bacterium]|nr:sugar phosphate isomerase/epimerase family protein [Vicinamibacterales bacterium]